MTLPHQKMKNYRNFRARSLKLAQKQIQLCALQLRLVYWSLKDDEPKFYYKLIQVCARDVSRETESNEKMPQLQQKNNKVDTDKPTKKEMKKIKLDQEKQLAKNIKQVLKNTNKEECIKVS